MDIEIENCESALSPNQSAKNESENQEIVAWVKDNPSRAAAYIYATKDPSVAQALINS